MSFVPPLTWAQDPQALKQTLSKSVKENKVQVTAAQDGKLKEMPWTKDFEKYPGLQNELTKLLVKIGDGIQAPVPRTESRLLALLPETTVGYVAVIRQN